ncbi:hypothetical protein QYF36_001067 [Acer negundo]|nr:hypothetical protein QYF36_001067 [Acer negundo]
MAWNRSRTIFRAQTATVRTRSEQSSSISDIPTPRDIVLSTSLFNPLSNPIQISSKMEKTPSNSNSNLPSSSFERRSLGSNSGSSWFGNSAYKVVAWPRFGSDEIGSGLGLGLVFLASEVASIVASCVLTRYVAISGSGGLISFTKDLVSGSGLTHSSSGRFSLGDTISESEFALIEFLPLKLCGSKYKTAFFRIVKMKLELPMLVFEVPVSTITFCLVKTISERWPSLAVNVSHR